MTEHLWDNETFQFSADTYTALLTAEMEIVQLAVSSLGNTMDNHQTSDRPQLINPSSTFTGNTHIIDFAPLDPTPPVDPKLSDLRAHYSRWLARVSGILSLHANETITISFPLLESLLHALASAATCSILNPPESVSTHHPQSSSTVGNRNYRFIIASSKNQSYTLSSDDLRMGPLGSLVDLLRKRPSFQDETTVQTCAVILKAYSALAPVLLQQTLKLDRLELQEAFDMSKWPHTPKSDMSGMKYIATRQALLSLRCLALSRTTNARHYAFLVDILKLMNVCYSHDKISKSKTGSYLALLQHSDDLVPMLEFAGESRSNIKLLPRDAMFHLLNIAQLWITNQHITPCESAFTPACFPVLLNMVRYTKFPEDGVEELLQAMIRRIRSENSSCREGNIIRSPAPAIQYLLCFTRSDRGFSSLVRALRPGNPISKPIAMGIIELTRIAVNRDPRLTVDPVELNVLAVPGFIAAISVVAKHCSGVTEHNPMLLEFSTNALNLLKVACSDATSKDLVVRHSACHKLRSALLQVQGDASAQELAAQLHEIAARPRTEIQGKARELKMERTSDGKNAEPGVTKPRRTTEPETEQILEFDDKLVATRYMEELSKQNQSEEDSLQEDEDDYV
ncbi:hypothetical protein BDV93DRAFT_82464 [Ceratobasidium sp. AG-I]|nr:hypothetical protein BDV93DRAFT_82464 [Ceratobasidium sp. AG-I]